MKKLLFLGMIFLCSCKNIPQYATAQPISVSQIQGGCFTSRHQFLDQAACIQSGLSRNVLNPYAQEYMATLQSLTAKVKAGKLPADDARLELTKELNRIKTVQDNAYAQQQALNNAAAMQQYEMLKQSAPKPLEVYKTSPILRSTNTNCTAIGNQVNCTSY